MMLLGDYLLNAIHTSSLNKYLDGVRFLWWQINQFSIKRDLYIEAHSKRPKAVGLVMMNEICGFGSRSRDESDMFSI